MPLVVFIRGGGDLASGTALRLHRAGINLLISELPKPLVIRRLVSYAETVYRGEFMVEGSASRLVRNIPEAIENMRRGMIPVIVDPRATSLTLLTQNKKIFSKVVIVDARMLKKQPGSILENVDLNIGLGPGFNAGFNCDVVIETNRGHNLGRLLWSGSPEANTGIPASINEQAAKRVLRAPADGIFNAHMRIGDHIDKGQLVASVSDIPIYATISGVLRGIIHPGIHVTKDLKIGDIDPRDNPAFCRLVSDKSLAIGGAVLEAILSRPDLRQHLWEDNCS